MRFFAGILLITFCFTTPMKRFFKREEKQNREWTYELCNNPLPVKLLKKKFDADIFDYDGKLTDDKINQEFLGQLSAKLMIFNLFNEKVDNTKEKKKLFRVSSLVKVVKLIQKKSKRKNSFVGVESFVCILQEMLPHFLFKDICWPRYCQLDKEKKWPVVSRNSVCLCSSKEARYIKGKKDNPYRILVENYTRSGKQDYKNLKKALKKLD